MANSIEIRTNEDGYRTRAYGFGLCDDLYLRFKFESPESDCEVAIAYDVYVDGDYPSWFVSDGELSDRDDDVIDAIFDEKLPVVPEWRAFRSAVDAAVSKFNGE